MDLASMIDSLFKMDPGSGLIQSILLMMIWLSVRSLKKMLEKLEVNHDTRITKLESRLEKHEGQILVLQTQGEMNAKGV